MIYAAWERAELPGLTPEQSAEPSSLVSGQSAKLSSQTPEQGTELSSLTSGQGAELSSLTPKQSAERSGLTPKEQSAEVRRLLGRLLAALGMDETAEVAKDALGAPYLPAYPGWHISLSHSGPFVACALADTPVGIDLEVWKHRAFREAMQRRLTEAECSYIRESEDPERAFHTVWVRRESFVKAVGTGLRLPWKAFSTVDENRQLKEDAAAQQDTAEDRDAGAGAAVQNTAEGRTAKTDAAAQNTAEGRPAGTDAAAQNTKEGRTAETGAAEKMPAWQQVWQSLYPENYFVWSRENVDEGFSLAITAAGEPQRIRWIFA